MQQAHVSTTNRSPLVIDTIQLTPQVPISTAEQLAGPHAGLADSPQATLPTPPASAGRPVLPLPSSVALSQLNRASPTTSVPSSPIATTAGSGQSSSVRTIHHIGGGQMGVQHQGAVEGLGHNRIPATTSRRSMLSRHMNVGGGQASSSPTGSVNPFASPLIPPSPSDSAAPRPYSEYYRQQYPNGQVQPQLPYAAVTPHSYNEQQQIVNARRHSYPQPQMQHTQNTSGTSGLPHSPSVPFVTQAGSRPHIIIPTQEPASAISHTRTGMAITPPVPEAMRQTPTATSSTVSSRPNSAVHPRSATSSHPQSPVVPLPQGQRIASQAPPYALQYAQPRQSYNYHQQGAHGPVRQSSTQSIPQVQAQTQHGQHQHALYSLQRPQQQQQQPQQQYQQPTPPAPQQQSRPHTYAQPVAGPSSQPQQTQHVQQQAQLLQQVQHVQQAQHVQQPRGSHQPQHTQSSQQPQQPQQSQPSQQPPTSAQAQQPSKPMPSPQATTHAQNVLQQSAQFLEFAYRSSVMSVAHEFERTNKQFHEMLAENKRLQGVVQQTEDERVWLRRERARLSDELTKRTPQNLIDLCKQYDGALRRVREEHDKLKEETRKLKAMNTILIQTCLSQMPPLRGENAGGEGAEGAAAAPTPTGPDAAELELISVGPFQMPRGLVTAVEGAVRESVVQEYEGRLAEAMADAARVKSETAKKMEILKILQGDAARVSASTLSTPAESSSAPVASTSTSISIDSGGDQPVPLVLPASISRRRTPEHTASRQPSPLHTLDSAHAIPTPPRTATPLERPAAQSDDPVIVKTEPGEGERVWPWSRGEIIDLTLLDSPPPLPPLELGLDALEARLNEELRAAGTSAEPETQQSEQMEQDGGEGMRTEKETTPEGEKKRGLEDNAEFDEGIARKKMRVEEDVVMDDSGGTSGGPETAEGGEGAIAGSQDSVLSLPSLDPPSSDHPMDIEPTVGPEAPLLPEESAPGSSAMSSTHPDPMNLVMPNIAEPPSASAPAILDPGPPPQASLELAEPKVKEEVQEPGFSDAQGESKPKFSVRHLALVYYTSKTELTCRMCFKRREADETAPVQTFPIEAPWAELVRHCEVVHPKGFTTLLNLTPDKLFETRKRLEEMDQRAYSTKRKK